MKTKRILLSAVTGLILTGSVAMAAHGNGQVRSNARVRATKATATTMMRTGRSTAVRTRNFTTSGNTAVRTRTFSSRNGVVSGGTVRYSRPYSSYGYSYGYPYYGSGYGYGPSVSFGFGYPYYSYGYYPYGYSYGYYPYDYSYGSYSYNQPGYGYNGSIVVQVQSRLAGAGYYHSHIDGVMGPGTRYAIRAYERDHGLRMDGAISGPLLQNMGLHS